MAGFTDAIAFMINLGVYDVVLPFLLVFTIVFALLEKTKVLGIEKIDGEAMPKQNLNAMVALVAGLLVVASTQLVSAINTILANVVLLLLLGVLFLLLVGTLSKDEEVELESEWKTALTIVMFIGILVIFLHALGWLNGLWNLALSGVDGTAVASIALIAVLVGGMAWITRGGKHKGNKGEGGD